MKRAPTYMIFLAALLTLGNGCGSDTNSGARQLSVQSPTAEPQTTPTPTAAALAFTRPLRGQLSLVDSVTVDLDLSGFAAIDDLHVTLDGKNITSLLTGTEQSLSGELSDVPAGTHRLSARIVSGDQASIATTEFETVALDNPSECEVLNNAACLLPYPSSRFLKRDGTATGYRVDFPRAAMPHQNSEPLNPLPYAVLDGFSPAAQILMHFPAGVDVVASGAPRLHEETRTLGSKSLDPDSPTILIDADTGERILHFVERDAWAEGLPERQVLYLRPARGLTPAHRYIVAARNLVSPAGARVEAEPVFAALRDGRPTTIDAAESRRAYFESIFDDLESAGIPRSELILAFDFVVQSDEVVAGDLRAMHNQALSWLDPRIEDGIRTFTVERTVEKDCSDPETFTWRIVEGTFEAPLFLDTDPLRDLFWPGVLNTWLYGTPIALDVMDAPFTISIPCAALRDGGTPRRVVLVGHDAYETGNDAVSFLSSFAGMADFDLVFAATDWLGQARSDQVFALHHLLNANAVSAFADRMRQGQVNALVLARMLKRAAFNSDPAFQTPNGVGALAGPDDELYFAGRGIGADNGLVLAAFSEDIDKAYVDSPLFSQGVALRRSARYPEVDALLQMSGVYDPIETALLLALRNELEARAWPGPYLAHAEPDHPYRKLAQTNILMTVAWLDQTSSSLGAEIAARSLGLSSLQGSCRPGLAAIADQAGPLSSAVVVYDTGTYDPGNPKHFAFLPPLANQPAAVEDTYCDPHLTRFAIPASLEQMHAFLQPDGRIESFCTDMCDAGEPSEIPFGEEKPCERPGV